MTPLQKIYMTSEYEKEDQVWLVAMTKDTELRIINSDSFTKTDITEYENLQEKQRQGNVRKRRRNELHRERG